MKIIFSFTHFESEEMNGQQPTWWRVSACVGHFSIMMPSSGEKLYLCKWCRSHVPPTLGCCCLLTTSLLRAFHLLVMLFEENSVVSVKTDGLKFKRYLYRTYVHCTLFLFLLAMHYISIKLSMIHLWFGSFHHIQQESTHRTKEKNTSWWENSF